MDVSAAVPADAMNASPRQRERARRSVELTGYVSRADGSTTAIQMLDLSYDGCRIGVDADLLAGERITISVPERGAIEAEVRWAKEGMAGLAFLPAAEETRLHVPRKNERVRVTAEVQLRRPGLTNFRVRIFDVSPAGCRIEFVDRPRANDRVWVKFDGLETLDAAVCWVDGFMAGVSFLKQLHPAVFDMLLTRLRT